jgi:hypothetical protein
MTPVKKRLKSPDLTLALERNRTRSIVPYSTIQTDKEPTMAVIVKALKDGPMEIAGGAKLLDVNGKEYVESAIDPLYLCRCGQSKNLL